MYIYDILVWFFKKLINLMKVDIAHSLNNGRNIYQNTNHFLREYQLSLTVLGLMQHEVLFGLHVS